LWKDKRQFGYIISMTDLKQHLLHRVRNGKFHHTFFSAMAFDSLVQIADR
jgi:hypothetical protein